MGDGLLSLNWNNHGATFCHTLASLRGKDKYTDVTVSCDGKFYQVHKLVLSTCSEYFEKIFENTPCKHPVIVLRDVHCEELESLLNYMYKGVVSVAQNDLSRLIKVAELLQIKGLAVPDEPPVTSKSPNKRTSDDRHSPRSNADNFSSISPYPKRRRRRESDSYQPSTSSSSSVQQPRNETSQPWDDEESRKVDDRLRETQQERVRSPVTVDVDETLIKEEIPDNDGGQEEILEDYSGMGIDPPSGGGASGDGSQDAAGGLMIPKFDETKDDDQSTTAVSLPDQVVEALAGPSGLQGWADGGDITRGLPLGEGFSGGESQDMPSSVGLPPQASGQQPHQMVEPDNIDVSLIRRDRTTDLFHCLFCEYSSANRIHLRHHLYTHTGQRPYHCTLCPNKFTSAYNLKRHMRTHTGEKPFSCSYCSYSVAHKMSLKLHLLRKHSDRASKF